MRLILAQIGKNETVVFAAKEIARLIGEMDRSVTVEIRRYAEKDPEVKNALWVGLDGSVEASDDDRIYIKTENGQGIIGGSNERSVLFSAYRFMQELGCRYLYPGRDGEKIPQRSLKDSDLTVFVDETPSYRHRGICIEGSVSYEHVFATIEWLPKLAMNTYYSQFFIPATFFKRYYGADAITDSDVAAMMEPLEDEIAKRGLIYHAVGHGWSSAPYGFYATGWEKYTGPISDEMRSSLALFGGERKFWNDMPISTQLCNSNPKVQERVTDFAVEYAKKHRNIHYLTFGLGDGGRNHCECEECKKKRPSDHQVNLINILCKKLDEAGLDTKISFSAYADTLYAPTVERIKDTDRTLLKFCPIARSFAHSYDEIDLQNLPETEPFVYNRDMRRNTGDLNVAYFRKWQEIYKGDTAVFDYQLMWNHHIDLGYYSVASLISRDIKDLRRLGLNGMISCQLLRSAFPNGLPQYTMAKTLWNKELSFNEIKDEYFSTAYGEYAKTVEDYLSELSRLTNPAFVIGEVKLTAGEVIKRYTEIKEKIARFSEEYIEKLKDTSDHWAYLYAHSQLAPIFADIYIARYSGDEDEVKAKGELLKTKLAELQPIIEPVCDDWTLTADWLTKYLSRHKPEEIIRN